MSTRTRVILTLLTVALGAGLQTVAQIVPIAMEPWQANMTVSIIVSLFSAALWVGAHPARRGRHARVMFSPRAPKTTAAAPAGGDHPATLPA
jgi:hypothetical protein